MALGNTYSGAPDQQGPVANEEPVLGNEWGGSKGKWGGILSGGLFGGPGPVGQMRNWAEQEYPIPFQPGSTSSLFGTTNFENGVMQMNASPALQGAMSGLFGTGASFVQQGQEMASQDWSGLRDEQLGILRELQRPEEERAVNSQMNQLFASGALGSTGGANMMGELAEAQEMSDLQRQLQSIQLAQQQQMMGMRMADAGSSLFGRGVQIGEPLFQQAGIGLDIGYGRSESRAAGGRIATQRQDSRRGFGGDLVGSVLGGLSGGGGGLFG